MWNRLTVPLINFILLPMPQRSSPFLCPVSLLFRKTLRLAQWTWCTLASALAPTRLHWSNPRETQVASLVPVHPPKFLSKVTLNMPPISNVAAELPSQPPQSPQLLGKNFLGLSFEWNRRCDCLIPKARTKSAMGMNLLLKSELPLVAEIDGRSLPVVVSASIDPDVTSLPGNVTLPPEVDTLVLEDGEDEVPGVDIAGPFLRAPCISCAKLR